MAPPLSKCYLNGNFRDIKSAYVSVLDRGFIFGDAVYEVIPVFNGTAFHLDLHLERLARSLDAIKIVSPMDKKAWRQLIYELIELNGNGDQSIYLQVTRGVAERDHAMPTVQVPTVFVFSSGLVQAEIEPVQAITAVDIRWQHCDIKATSLLGNVLLRTEAAAQHAVEAILFRDGILTEGAASNVFLVINKRVYTSCENEHILAGITRRLLIDILAETSFAVIEEDITKEAFVEASEVWVTSSSKDLLPVTKCDGQSVGTGVPGEVFLHVRGLFGNYKTDWLAAEKARQG